MPQRLPPAPAAPTPDETLPPPATWSESIVKWDKDASEWLYRLASPDTNHFVRHTRSNPFIPVLHGVLQYRATLKALEISAHGVPWLLAVPWLIVVADPSIAFVLVNLMTGLLLDIAAVGSFKFLWRRNRPVYNKSELSSTCYDFHRNSHFSFISKHRTHLPVLLIL